MLTRLPALVPVLAVLVFCAPASGATYFVAVGGNDADDCSAATPCATVQAAIDQHLLSPAPDDVISIGPGDFAGNFAADQPDDDGLVIHGTVAGGVRQTNLHAVGAGNVDGAAATIGGCGVASVTLKDANIDTVGADADVRALTLNRTSRLENVSAQNQTVDPTLATEVVFACSGTPTITDSTIVATASEDAVVTDGGLVMRDTVVQAEDGVAVGQDSGLSDIVIQRSVLQVSEFSPNPVLPVLGGLMVDSSLLSGGAAGAVMGLGVSWVIRNSTIDAGAPGVSDPSTPTVVLDPFLGSGDLAVNSSALVDDVEAIGLDGGTVTCRHSDLPQPAPASGWTIDCTPGVAGNRTTDPAALFVGGAPFDWQLRAGASAIDAGDPAALVPGESTTDVLGNPRLRAGNCGDPRRDIGAFERVGGNCGGSGSGSPPPATSTDTTGPSAPTLTGTDPASPADDNTPAVLGSAEAGTTVRLYASDDCSGSSAATGPAEALASPGLAAAVLDNTTTTFSATATDAAGNVSPCSNEIDYVEATGALPGDCANLIVGTAAADRLEGTEFGNLIRGLEGDDLILGLAGNDCLDGAAGDDRLWGNDGDDALSGGDGDDQLKGRTGDDQLRGGAGNDRMTGADGADDLQGAAGDDRLSGGFGADLLAAGRGNDRIYGGRGVNEYRGGRGDDRITSANGVDETVKCGPGNDTVIADEGDNLVGCESELVRR